MLLNCGPDQNAATARLTGRHPSQVHVRLGVRIGVLHHVDAVRTEPGLNQVAQLKATQVIVVAKVTILVFQCHDKADVAVAIEGIKRD